MRKTRNSAGERTGAAPGLAATQEARWPETRLRIGISGWTYPPWRGVFYPKTLGQRDELRYASRQHNTIEINGSFYSLQMPSSYERWYAETPANFIFSVKGARFITHMKKLRDIETPLANFFGSGLLALREKLGPILWQFPPNFGWNEERFRSFFNLLPQNTAEAAELTNLHDEKLKYGSVEQSRCGPADSVCGRDPASYVSGSGILCASARVQHRLCLRRHRGQMALRGRFHGQLRLHSLTRSGAALR